MCKRNYIKYNFLTIQWPIPSVPEQWSLNLEIADFVKFLKKTELPENLNSWTRADSNPQNREETIPAPWPIHIHKLSMMFIVWNISIGQPVSLPGCAPSQLPHTRL